MSDIEQLEYLKYLFLYDKDEYNGHKQLHESLIKNLSKTKVRNIKNKGYGAGGSKTNKNGLSYEEKVDLSTHYNIIGKFKYNLVIKFQGCNNEFVKTCKSDMFKYLSDKIDKNVTPPGHGCKSPDECYINEKKNIIFIIEKKFQQVNGSVCEKIQTSEFKKWQYKKLFPTYNIVYIYCLSNWFKTNCKSELEYLDHIKTAYFFGQEKKYKEKIVKYITNYK